MCFCVSANFNPNFNVQNGRYIYFPWSEFSGHEYIYIYIYAYILYIYYIILHIKDKFKPSAPKTDGKLPSKRSKLSRICSTVKQ